MTWGKSVSFSVWLSPTGLWGWRQLPCEHDRLCGSSLVGPSEQSTSFCHYSPLFTCCEPQEPSLARRGSVAQDPQFPSRSCVHTVTPSDPFSCPSGRRPLPDSWAPKQLSGLDSWCCWTQARRSKGLPVSCVVLEHGGVACALEVPLAEFWFMSVKANSRGRFQWSKLFYRAVSIFWQGSPPLFQLKKRKRIHNQTIIDLYENDPGWYLKQGEEKGYASLQRSEVRLRVIIGSVPPGWVLWGEPEEARAAGSPSFIAEVGGGSVPPPSPLLCCLCFSKTVFGSIKIL